MVDAADDNGVTPLMYAALEGDTQRMHKLIEQGACLYLRNHSGRTALMFAALRSE